MPNIRELEILHTEEKTGRPIAVSYDPGAFSEETVKSILINQITNPSPLEIHCYIKGAYNIGGVYKTIEAQHFTALRNQDENERKKFIAESLELIKGLDTYDVIFSEPLTRK